MFKKCPLSELLLYQKEKILAGKFLTVNGDDLYSNSPYLLKNYRYENFPNEKLKKSGYNNFFRKGDVLFLTIRANRKIWLADQDGICNSSIKVIIPNQEIAYSKYLIIVLLSENITN